MWGGPPGRSHMAARHAARVDCGGDGNYGAKGAFAQKSREPLLKGGV